MSDLRTGPAAISTIDCLASRAGCGSFAPNGCAVSPKCEPSPRRFSASAYDAVRIVFASILIGAALLKAHAAATDFPTRAGVYSPLWLQILIVESEIAMAFWLLSNVAARWAYRASLAMVAAFTLVSLYRLLSGESDCGCFGGISVHPMITLMLDVAIGVALLCFSPEAANRPVPTHGAASSLTATVAASGLLILAPSLGLWMSGYPVPVLPMASEQVAANAVLLDPTEWQGKRLPLLKHAQFSEGANIGSGDWAIIVYDRNCEKCQRLIAQREQSLRASAQRAITMPRIAFLDITPDAASMTSERSEIVRGSLPANAVWVAAVPMELSVRDGIVSDVRVASPE